MHESTERPAVPVTIVVPAYNAAATIGDQLSALAVQDHRGVMEVIVVDNDSDDGTADVARSFRDRIPNLRVVDARDQRSVARARNAGFAAASHELVLVCDADDVVDAQWASGLAGALQTADLVGGGVVEWLGGSLPATRPHAFMTGVGFLPSFGGCNFGTTRRVWTAIGGFDESLLSGEDFDFAWRAQLDGYTYASQPGAFVYYRINTEPRAVFRKWRHYGTYEPALYAKFRGHGFRRQPLLRAAGRWGLLALTSYRLAVGPRWRRVKWCRDVGRRVGRLQGSIKARALFL